MLVLLALTFVDLFVPIFTLVLIARIIAGFVASPESPMYAGLVSMTEPLLVPVRRLLPASPGVDWAPLLVCFLLQAIQFLVDGFVH